MAQQTSRHRTVPRTARAPTRDGCIREALLGTVASFQDYLVG